MKQTLSIVVALAYGATLTACSPTPTTPVSPAAVPAVAQSRAAGKVEISRSGSGLLVKLVNPKDGG